MTTNNAINQATGAQGTLLQGQGVGTAPLFKSLSVVNQFFGASGTYTPTAGMLYCIVQIVGGGGGGGGSTTTVNSTCASGGGGGGEYAQGIFSAATIGVSQAVTCGAGGTSSAGAGGNTGGTTSLGSLITAIGGAGAPVAEASATTLVSNAGAAGGSGGSGGTFRVPGGAGFRGLASFPLVFSEGGQGGSSMFGSGGIEQNAGDGNPGNPGLGYGAGGSGTTNYGSITQQAGGAGTIGCILITEYVIS